MVLLVLQRFSALDAALTLTTSRDAVLADSLLPKEFISFAQHIMDLRQALSPEGGKPSFRTE